MKSRWDEGEAAATVQRYASHGRDLALRVYTSRLIGADADLVLHGGGNTSVKTTVRDVLGRDLRVICVKGSGSDLATVEPRDLPALELEPLLRLRELDALGDEAMVNQLRTRLLDATSPTPSVETLLHAFLPHRFVDHTHADAILVLTNQPDGETLVRRALGEAVVVLPWIMPGFPLAKAVAAAWEERPDCEGIVLLQHGLFTFADEARASYERMVDLVDRAERFIAERAREGAGPAAPPPPAQPADAAAAARVLAERVLPVVRGALAWQAGDRHGVMHWRRVVAEWRGGADVLAFVARPDCGALAATGPLTPDHVIRTKAEYLVLDADEAMDPERCRQAIAGYVGRYVEYFRANEARAAGARPTMLHPHPCIVLVAGAGLLAFGGDKKAALVAADIAEHTLTGKARAQAIGRYVDLPRHELFAMEYWSLEQAKLGKAKPPLLAGQVALVTGGGGAIGHGVADALLEAGAHVVLTDVDETRLARARERLLAQKHPHLRLQTVTADVTDEGQVRDLFAAACLRFGGVDLLVANAGVAHVAPLVAMDVERFRHVLEVNSTGTMLVLKEAARVFAAQHSGGCVVVQASKNVFDPGASFGAYSASKAAAHQLGKVAALELAPLGVRVNLLNADAVFGDEVPSGLWEEVGPDRMRARGLDPAGLREYYRKRNLLQVEVKPAHVGVAVVFLAGAALATTGATLPIDGGIPGAFPR